MYISFKICPKTKIGEPFRIYPIPVDLCLIIIIIAQATHLNTKNRRKKDETNPKEGKSIILLCYLR